jgi:Carboxypeptidase regulatory-like domain
MRRWLCALWFTLLVLGGVGLSAQQQASVAGTILDASKAVLPGVTVTATELSSGRVYTGITDERGEFRLPNIDPGRYRVQAELPGFATVTVSQIELLVGQNANIPFVLNLATLRETVTVTSETPLVDISSSEVAGNINRRQMAELPLQGRNWQELSLLIKGITANNVTNTPGVSSDDAFQLNLDGQQITQRVAGSGFGQPKISREAIAEFQIVTNLFDITQGRSTGIQVQAISRSGTNDLRGSAFGFFRSDKFNGKDQLPTKSSPSRTSRWVARWAARSFGTRRISLAPTSTSGSPRRRSFSQRGCRTRPSRSSRNRRTRTIWAAWTISSRARTTSRSAGSGGTSTIRSKSPAAPPIRRGPNSSRNMQPTFSRAGRGS